MSEEETQKISHNLKVRLDERALEALIKYKCEIVIQFICKIIMFENNLLVGEMDNDDLKSIVDLVVEGNQMARNKIRNDVYTRKANLKKIGDDKMRKAINDHIEGKRTLIGWDHSQIDALYNQVKEAIKKISIK